MLHSIMYVLIPLQAEVSFNDKPNPPILYKAYFSHDYLGARSSSFSLPIAEGMNAGVHSFMGRVFGGESSQTEMVWL